MVGIFHPQSNIYEPRVTNCESCCRREHPTPLSGISSSVGVLGWTIERSDFIDDTLSCQSKNLHIARQLRSYYFSFQVKIIGATPSIIPSISVIAPYYSPNREFMLQTSPPLRCLVSPYSLRIILLLQQASLSLALLPITLSIAWSTTSDYVVLSMFVQYREITRDREESLRGWTWSIMLGLGRRCAYLQPVLWS